MTTTDATPTTHSKANRSKFRPMTADDVVTDMTDRLTQALDAINAMADDARAKSDYDEMRRLRGKAEGIDLARDYLRVYRAM